MLVRDRPGGGFDGIGWARFSISDDDFFLVALGLSLFRLLG